MDYSGTKLSTDIHGSQRVNSVDFGDPKFITSVNLVRLTFVVLGDMSQQILEIAMKFYSFNHVRLRVIPLLFINTLVYNTRKTNNLLISLCSTLCLGLNSKF